MSTEYVFFSGKGGVGKTTMACAPAVGAAERARRTLIVTTDPASNLADVFEQPIGHRIAPIHGIPNLHAMEIDPDQATREYIDRAMAPLRAAFPAQMVQVMEEQMSGPCTAEVADAAASCREEGPPHRYSVPPSRASLGVTSSPVYLPLMLR